MGELLAKNRARIAKKTTRQTTSAIWRIFAHLNNLISPKLADKHALSKMNLIPMEVRMF